jgi:soluble lytic murein transglycosylase-like protein
MSILDYLIFLFLSVLVLAIGCVYTPNVFAQSNQNQIENYIVQSAKVHHINPKLALAIAKVESGLNPQMIGSLGEVGVFQLRPEYHEVIVGDVKQNIDVAMNYLEKLKHQCSSYGDAFFVCYNYGPTRILKHPRLFPYYKRVQYALRNPELRKIASNQ